MLCVIKSLIITIIFSCGVSCVEKSHEGNRLPIAPIIFPLDSYKKSIENGNMQLSSVYLSMYSASLIFSHDGDMRMVIDGLRGISDDLRGVVVDMKENGTEKSIEAAEYNVKILANTISSYTLIDIASRARMEINGKDLYSKIDEKLGLYEINAEVKSRLGIQSFPAEDLAPFLREMYGKNLYLYRFEDVHVMWSDR